MTHTVHFTPEALDQLDQLEVDISGAASPAIAARYVDSIVDYCENGVTTRKWRICPTFKNVSGIQVGLTVDVVAFSALRAS